MIGQLPALAPLPSVLTEWETGWAPEPVWTFWRRGNAPAVTGTRKPDHLTYSLVTTRTELSGCWYSVFIVPVKYRVSFQPNCYGSCLQIK